MIDEYITTQMANYPIPGLSAAVVIEGTPVLMKGYGWANLELSVPATEHSVYEIASVSKTFTATTTMMLVENNEISLDDSITRFLDTSPPAWKPITIKHILCHQSGIRDYLGVPEYWQTTRLDVPREQIIGLVSQLPLMFAPGESWSYDNTGYYLLGFMLEKVSGKPYDALLRELIFKPLEMNVTVMNSPAAIIKNRAAGYRLENNTLYNKEYYSPSGTFSSGGWLSSVADLVKWEAALYSEKLLKRTTLEQMWTPHESVRRNEHSSGFTQGLGWYIPSYPKRKVVTHNGGIKGFSANMTRFIDDSITVILLCNLECMARPDVISKGIAEYFIPGLASEPLQPAI